CGVNAIAPGRRSRTRDAIKESRHVFLEADHDGSSVLARVAERGDLPKPSYVLTSSPGRFHILWRAAGFDTERAEALQKRLARELGTDAAATPASQTTRLAGFYNRKYDPLSWSLSRTAMSTRCSRQRTSRRPSSARTAAPNP